MTVLCEYGIISRKKKASCELKILRDGGPTHVPPTARLYVDFGLIFSAFPICSPIFQEHHKVIQTPQHVITLRYLFYNDMEVMLTLLPQDYTKKGAYLCI